MDEEIMVAAMREEGQKIAVGVRDAVAILIALVCAMTKTKPSRFIAAARDAAKALTAEGNDYAAAVLEGACKRLEDPVKQTNPRRD